MAFSVAPNPDVAFEVVHEDSELIVVNKPAGVPSQPGKKHAHDSLLNGLFVSYGNALQNLGEERNWGLLHRLDKDTSGLLLVALRPRAYEQLSEQFKNRQVKKIYHALVHGTPKPSQGVIQLPIAEVIGARKKAVIRRDGKQAITAYRVIQTNGKISFIEARPATGRLHQIRVHLASLGCPVIGENTYARSDAPQARENRLCLHASEISFIHPASGNRLSFQASIPSSFTVISKKLGLPTQLSGLLTHE